MESSDLANNDSMRCFEFLSKQLMNSYSQNQFQAIPSQILKDLKYLANILIFEFLKKELMKKGDRKETSPNVIDVDLAEDS